MMRGNVKMIGENVTERYRERTEAAATQKFNYSIKDTQLSNLFIIAGWTMATRMPPRG